MSAIYHRFGIRTLPSMPAGVPFVGRDDEVSQRFERYRQSGRAAIADEFVGITADGQVVPDLFSLEPTGVSTQPLVDAANAFLQALDDGRRTVASFGVDDPMWRAWSNTHPFVLRHGVALADCTPEQRERGLDLVRATCSARGFRLARDIMRLNDALGEITGRSEEYGEWYYWLSIFGTPSTEQPWGWQIDGHHLIISCFVLGDQLVMTPSFFGSEPTAMDTGKHAGTRVFEDEEQQALWLVRSLSPAQRAAAIPGSTEGLLRPQRMDGRIQAAAFRDNIQMPYAGLAAAELDTRGKRDLLDLLEIYVGRLRDGHARIRLDEVARHLEAAHFLWVGGIEDDSVFYYRIHSPVILVEFDHLGGIAFDNDAPSRNHIHTVVRTPNGNDYGRDLLRQHYARHHRAVATAP